MMRFGNVTGEQRRSLVEVVGRHLKIIKEDIKERTGLDLDTGGLYKAINGYFLGLRDFGRREALGTFLEVFTEVDLGGEYVGAIQGVIEGASIAGRAWRDRDNEEMQPYYQHIINILAKQSDKCGYADADDYNDDYNDDDGDDDDKWPLA